MNYEDMIKNIKEGKVENIYLIYGTEYYLIDRVLDSVKGILNKSMIDFNLEILNGKELILKDLINSIEILPFMDERRVIIVKDFEIFIGKKKNLDLNDEEYFSNYIENIPKTTTILFANYGEIDKRKSIIKKLKKIGQILEFPKLDEKSLFKWIKEKFEENRVHIDSSLIVYFISQSGYTDRNSVKTLMDLLNDISKISFYIGEGNAVNRESIDILLGKKVENDIFKLIDYIGNKRSSRALKVLEDMLNDGESVLGIFSMISRQFKLIIQCKKLKEEKYTTKQISDVLKVHQFVVNRAIKQSVNFSNKDILLMLNYILDSDYKIKNGIIKDKLAAEIFISKF